MKIVGLFFDLDGVLYDSGGSSGPHAKALIKAIYEVSGYKMTKEEHEKRFEALPTKTKLKMLADDGTIKEEQIEPISKLKQNYTLKVLDKSLKPDSQKYNMLKQLHEDGYRMATVSNSVRSTTALIIERLGLSGFFEFLLSNEDAENKPSPALYNLAVKKMGLKSLECVIIEDSPVGITAARDSGCHYLAVCGVSCVNYNTIKSFIDQIEKDIK